MTMTRITVISDMVYFLLLNHKMHVSCFLVHETGERNQLLIRNVMKLPISIGEPCVEKI